MEKKYMLDTSNGPLLTTEDVEHGKLYWFCRKSMVGTKNFFVNHKVAAAIVLTLAILLAVIFRDIYQPLVLAVRIYFPPGIFWAAIGSGLWCLVRKQSRLKKVAVVAVYACCTIVFVAGLFSYVSLWYNYQTLNVVELSELPITGHERIQPMNSIYSLGHEAMTETEAPTSPDFIRIGDTYRWTMAIEPSYPLPRYFEPIKELYSVSGTAAYPGFSNEHRVKVHFEFGENLVGNRSTHVCATRAFGLWRFLNYQPSQVAYMTDDSGAWVQVVSLIRWDGFFFPRPSFGGVQVVHQDHVAGPGRVLLGCGIWIPPSEIVQHKYLHGQNILPVEVSRYDANSFRFQNGFFSPMPGFHSGDIRIPDLPEDVNNEPFTAYFEGVKGQAGGLYHYFGLEPFDKDKQGLNTSLFVPADGSDMVYAYRHHLLGGTLVGVSAISAKVIESKKMYDWTRNHPVEHRPFIRVIDGKQRFFWLTTVVTYKAKEGDRHSDSSRFIAGSMPEVVLTDAIYNTSVWVDSQNPDSWIPQLRKELSGVWAQH